MLRYRVRGALRALGVAHMAEDNGGSPLPRRVPGATDSPRPPTKIEQPVLPESVRRRLLRVIAREQESAAGEPATPPQTAVAEERPTAPDGTDPPPERTPSPKEKAPPKRATALGKAGSPHKAGSPEPAPTADQAVPLPRWPGRAADRPTWPPEASGDILPDPPPVVRADALTEPFLRVSAPVQESDSASVNPAVTQAAPQPDRPTSMPDTAMGAVPDTRTTAVPDTPATAVSAGRVAGQQAVRRKRQPVRRYRVAGVLLSVTALIIGGSVVLVFYGHGTTSVTPRGHQHPPAPGDGQEAAQDQAAAWVAAQVGRTTTVSADPAMCRVLEAHGVPPRDLYELTPETNSPLRSAVIVATPAVRAQFGTLLNSAYAPAVLASFGSGRQRVDIREVAMRGAAAYRSMLAADLAARKSSSAELLRSNRITVSPTARRQLSAGQVDSRLLITVATMASKHPIYIVAFNSFAPGADVSMPLRFADLTQASPGHLVGSRPLTLRFVRSMVGFLRAQHAPYRPLQVKTVTLAGGHTVLRIGFAAPSPLGLFGSR
jgi:hypothetical protein